MILFPIFQMFSLFLLFLISLNAKVQSGEVVSLANAEARSIAGQLLFAGTSYSSVRFQPARKGSNPGLINAQMCSVQKLKLLGLKVLVVGRLRYSYEVGSILFSWIIL